MPLTYAYQDPYLANLVTPEREARALSDVQAWRNDFPAAWLERLTRLRAYVIVCQESQKATDDLFSAKLTEYRREFEKLLPQATTAALAAAAAAAEAAGDVPGRTSVIAIDIERA